MNMIAMSMSSDQFENLSTRELMQLDCLSMGITWARF